MPPLQSEISPEAPLSRLAEYDAKQLANRARELHAKLAALMVEGRTVAAIYPLKDEAGVIVADHFTRAWAAEEADGISLWTDQCKKGTGGNPEIIPESLAAHVTVMPDGKMITPDLAWYGPKAGRKLLDNAEQTQQFIAAEVLKHSASPAVASR